MSRNQQIWAARILTALTLLFLAFDTAVKLMQSQVALDATMRLGYPQNLVFRIGLIELFCVAIYAFPGTSILGAVLLTGYLGGATATHFRIGDPFFFPILVGVMVWGSVYLNDERLRAVLPFRR